MKILGISAFYHDAAAALVIDGDIVAAAQEERFTRTKHDSGFPTNAIRFCLEHAKLRPADLDYVAFYDKPFVKFERLLETYLAYAPRGFESFRQALPVWVKEKLFQKDMLIRALTDTFGKGVNWHEKLLFSEHHLSHAASAFFCSPFEEAAVLTVDGVGEWTTTTLGRASASWRDGSRNRIDLTREMRFPHSLGLLYSAFTAWLGFEVNEGEYKVMGMAPYGRPLYRDKLEKLLTLHGDGSFHLNMDYFSYHYSPERTFNDRFVRLWGQPRIHDAEFFCETTGHDISGREEVARRNQYYADVAASVQLLTEEVLLQMVRQLHAETGLSRLVMATTTPKRASS